MKRICPPLNTQFGANFSHMSTLPVAMARTNLSIISWSRTPFMLATIEALSSSRMGGVLVCPREEVGSRLDDVISHGLILVGDNELLGRDGAVIVPQVIVGHLDSGNEVLDAVDELRKLVVRHAGVQQRGDCACDHHHFAHLKLRFATFVATCI